MKVMPADIYFNLDNTPTSRAFDDVYFSNTNGVDETDHVFINGNDLINRWQTHKEAQFCIAETGFGTGLNFFRTMQHFQLFKQKHPEHILTTLVFISTEKHPIAKADLINIYDRWHSENFLLTSLEDKHPIQQWLNQYPISIEGVHRRHFEFKELHAAVKLDLHYGDAITSLSQIQQSKHGVVDAWFLDGFSPSKNDSMWKKALFENMAKLSKSGATFATFTAAGFVKRGLLVAGFEVHKRKGFGKKREMLTGLLIDRKSQQASATEIKPRQIHIPDHRHEKIEPNQAPYFARQKSNNSGVITIAGNGIAGAILAVKLTLQGKNVHLLWQGNEPADAASGNPIGGFYPQLNAQNNHASQIQLHSFLYAFEFYTLLNHAQSFDHNWCGALQLAFNDNTKTRLAKLANSELWPTDVAKSLNSVQASDIAGIPIPYDCLHLPKAGWISPPSLVNACIQLAKSTNLLRLSANTHLHRYTTNTDETVTVNISKTGEKSRKNITTDTLIIALGAGCKPLLNDLIPLRLTRGQVELVSSKAGGNASTISKLNTLLCHKGYFTPVVDGFQALGSTYIKDDIKCETRNEDTDANFDMHLESMRKASWQDELAQARHNKSNKARAAIRCSTPDHLPIVGSIPSHLQFTELKDLYKALPLAHYPNGSIDKNVFVLTGLGSRGLTTAPLMAEILVSQILGQPMPMTKVLLDALNPNRFIVRSLIRRQSWE
jgi:tRNA 5-methylaminomethyl-2-thiouridine biosynthesis bifunctional protein